MRQQWSPLLYRLSPFSGKPVNRKQFGVMVIALITLFGKRRFYVPPTNPIFHLIGKTQSIIPGFQNFKLVFLIDKRLFWQIHLFF